MPSFTEKIDALLPQTQCQQCGYPRCFDYAEALASGEAAINRCPPGGRYTRKALAQLLQTTPMELDPACGTEGPRLLYRVREQHCIGCTLCIQACPVDAIIGSARKMHTILMDECTGCGLCVPVCPVDCIDESIHPAASGTSGRWPGFTDEEVERARRRTNSRLGRLARQKQQTAAAKDNRKSDFIRDEITAAVARVKQKRSES